MCGKSLSRQRFLQQGLLSLRPFRYKRPGGWCRLGTRVGLFCAFQKWVLPHFEIEFAPAFQRCFMLILEIMGSDWSENSIPRPPRRPFVTTCPQKWIFRAGIFERYSSISGR